MKDSFEKEHLVHFLNLPPKEQMLFILNQKLEGYLRDKYRVSLGIEKENES